MDGPGCPQHCELPPHTCPPTQSEDCLILNVFSPAGSTNTSMLPVMLFIHGGNYKQGYAGGLLYDGNWLSSHHDVVVVVIQYRLGALGFLYTPNGIDGNYGIQDQQMAFKWVQANIQAFGGDPARVTGFGQSAGAMSMAVHLITESSKGLFQNAILESEPFGLPYRTPATWEPAAKALAKYSGCSTSGDFDSCLMEASYETLISSQVEVEKDLLADLSDMLQLFLPWTPTVGTDMLPNQPMGVWQNGDVHDVPITIGTVWNEATVFVYEAFKKAISKTEYDVVLGLIFGLGDAIAIGEHFPVPANETHDARLTAAKVATQALFTCATRNVSLVVSEKHTSPYHVYHYDHLASFGKLEWGTNFSICWTEVCHAAELAFVWHPNATKVGSAYTPQEQILSQSIETYWTNVAKTGSPGTFNGLTWPQFDAATQQTIKFETPANIVQDHYFEDICAFWDNLGWWAKHVGN